MRLQGFCCIAKHSRAEQYPTPGVLHWGLIAKICRRARTIPEQLKELKAELPAKDSEGNRPAAPQLEREIAELEKVGWFALSERITL